MKTEVTSPSATSSAVPIEPDFSAVSREGECGKYEPLVRSSTLTKLGAELSPVQPDGPTSSHVRNDEPVSSPNADTTDPSQLGSMLGLCPFLPHLPWLNICPICFSYCCLYFTVRGGAIDTSIFEPKKPLVFYCHNVDCLYYGRAIKYSDADGDFTSEFPPTVPLALDKNIHPVCSSCGTFSKLPNLCTMCRLGVPYNQNPHSQNNHVPITSDPTYRTCQNCFQNFEQDVHRFCCQCNAFIACGVRCLCCLARRLNGRNT